MTGNRRDMAAHRSDNKTVTIWYLGRYLRPYRWLVVFTMVFLLAGRFTTSLDPIWLKKIIDQVASGQGIASMASIIAIYFGIRTLSFIFDFLRDLIFAPAEMGIAKTLSRELFSHLLSLPVMFHHEQKLGGLSRQITRGGRAVTFMLDFLVINILPTIFELIFVTVLLLRLYPPVYAVITFFTIVFYAVFTVWATEKRQKYRLGMLQADDEVGGIEGDTLGNIDTVKFFNNEALMKDRYEPAIQKRFRLGVTSNQLFSLIAAGQALIVLVGLGAILFLAIQHTISGSLSIGDLVLLTTYVTRLSAPIGTLGFVYRNIKDGLSDLDAMAKILAEDITVAEPEHPLHINDPKGELAFENVSFGYTGKREVLHNVEFRIEPGQRVAFVGPSGAGKSTIVKLLFRFFDPTSGRIVVDGVDLRELSKEDRLRLFAIVPQEPALFNATIAENIRFGKPDATQKEIEAAATLASIDALIQSLPDKYETVVGERGVKLSGGEKQRVAIARAIIRDPKILVFDEATSSLDSKSEKDIQQALDAVSQGRTTVAVAHRLSTIADSDRIFVLGKGGIAEHGTHAKLLAKKGVYARLWKIQASHHNAETGEDS